MLLIIIIIIIIIITIIIIIIIITINRLFPSQRNYWSNTFSVFDALMTLVLKTRIA